jgi:hypothetical protein
MKKTMEREDNDHSWQLPQIGGGGEFGLAIAAPGPTDWWRRRFLD